MRIGQSYKQIDIQGDFDTIVVGSGPGGLATAALLAKHKNERVLVLERHYTAGGFSHTFKRPGFEWDVGVHYIGEVHLQDSMMRKLFDHVTDGTLEWASMGDVYDRIHIGEDVYEYRAGRREFIEQMVEYFPNERSAIEQYVQLISDANDAAQSFFTAKALPGFLAWPVGAYLRSKAKRFVTRTTHEVLSELTDNPRLRAVLTGQYGDYGLPPAESCFFMHAMVANHYIKGAAYPVGGASRIAESMLPLIEERGGLVVTNADVEEILVEGGRAVGVKVAGGKRFMAPRIVSDAGIRLTVNRLLPPEVAADSGLKEKLSTLDGSCAHLSLYVGLDRPDTEFDLPKANSWLYPSENQDADWARFMKDSDAPFPLVYVSFPSAKDPAFQTRFPGHATLEVVVPIPSEVFSRWQGSRWQKRGEEYVALKDRFRERLLDELYKHRPELKGHVVHAELSTPLTTEHFAAHPSGEIYGVSHNRTRFEANWLKPRLPIKGLFLTGADASTAGIGGALAGAVLCVSTILNRNLMASAMRGAKRPVVAEAAAPAE